MKKIAVFFLAIMFILTGCSSGISQADYDAVVAERDEALAQIDLYINYYDFEIKRDDDNPTIGLLLVTEQDKLVAKYSSIYNNDNIFVSKYMTYMPTEKELEQIINKEKEIIEEYKKIKELEKK